MIIGGTISTVFYDNFNKVDSKIISDNSDNKEAILENQIDKKKRN